MYSNFEHIKRENNPWLNLHFDCGLPGSLWRAEAYSVMKHFHKSEDKKPPSCCNQQ